MPLRTANPALYFYTRYRLQTMGHSWHGAGYSLRRTQKLLITGGPLAQYPRGRIRCEILSKNVAMRSHRPRNPQ
jgi:hypothetical protein